MNEVKTGALAHKLIDYHTWAWLSGILSAAAIALLPFSTSLTDIAFILAALSGLAAMRQQTWQRIIDQGPAKLMTIFLAALVIGVSYSVADWSQAMRILKKYSELLLALLMAGGLMYDQWYKRAYDWFMAAMTVAALLVLWQILTPWHLPLASRSANSAGTLFKSYIHMSFLLAFFAYLCAVKALAKHHLGRYFWFGLSAVATLAVLLSEGRTGYIVLACLGLLLVLQSRRFKLAAVWALLFFAAGMAILALSGNMQQHVMRAWHSYQAYQQGDYDTSLGKRLVYMKGASRLFMRHPVLGTGTGSFQHAYSRLDPKPPLQTDDPHNEYLYIGVMLGGVGVALLIALFYTLYLSGEDLPFEHRLLVQGAAVSIAVGCMANSFILASTEGHFFAFWCAWAIAALARRERSTA